MVKEKRSIMIALRDEPMGLTIQEISRRCRMNRMKITVFLHELLGEGRVSERKVGAYRLFKIKRA